MPTIPDEEQNTQCREREREHLAILVLIVTLAVALRTWQINTEFGGKYWEDEITVSRTYLGNLLRFAPQYAGANPLFYETLSLIWCIFFGTSMIAARMFAVVVGSAASGATFFLIRSISDSRTGLFAAALIALSVPAVHISRYAVESGSPLLFLPLAALVVLSMTARGKAFAAGAGALVAIFLFTYPAYLLGLCAAALTTLLLSPRTLLIPISSRTIFSLSFFTALLIGALTHRLLEPVAPLFFGGGNFTGFDPRSYVENAFQLLFELLIDAGSFYAEFDNFPYLEPALCGFFIIGLINLYRQSATRKASYAVILFLLISLALVSCTGSATIGIRRMIFILPVFYGVSALGMSRFARSSGIAPPLLIAATALHGVFFNLAILMPQETDRARTIHSPFIADEPFERLMKDHRKTILISEEFEFGSEYYLSYADLLRWIYRRSRFPGSIEISPLEDAIRHCNSDMVLVSRRRLDQSNSSIALEDVIEKTLYRHICKKEDIIPSLPPKDAALTSMRVP